ncbi:MAG: type II toxin-antitoxin system HicB family antitoxin [Bryobacterales bacterium]|nr:type II toxin-antitoxin system HicB family antitoxin [Bryobacterales bacterium]
MQFHYTVQYEPLPEGGFQVHVPAIPEIVTFGRTLEEARRMAEDAIRCVLESTRREGEPVPKDIQPSSEVIAIQVA